MIKKTKFWYTTSDVSEGDEPDYSFETIHIDEDEYRYVAEEAAQDYFDHHDGWESSWPLTITLFADYDINDEQKKLGAYEVECEAVPSFRARAK